LPLHLCKPTHHYIQP